MARTKSDVEKKEEDNEEYNSQEEDDEEEDEEDESYMSGMFTSAGDDAVGDLIDELERRDNLTEEEVCEALEQLAESNPKFGEATDTVVREYVLECLDHKFRK